MPKCARRITIALAFVLAACVTVNIYFPAAEIQKAADQIVDDVRGTPEKGKPNSKEGANSSFLDGFRKFGIGPGSAYAQINIEVSTPAIRSLRQALESRGYRAPKGLNAFEWCEAVAYALWNLEDRGPMMVDPGVDVYEGMIIGEHSRENDLEVNPIKGKQLTNIRTQSKDEAVRLTPPKKLSLEQSLGYIADDEYVEVTPKSIRLRKIWLDPNERKKQSRAAKAS